MRDHDIVVYGATGYVGALVAAYLADTAPSTARVALAGRNRQKLETLRAGLAARASEWPIVTADAGDVAELTAMAASTTVVAATVGPYAKHGLPLVGACAGQGTHYCDLTGEVLFHRAAIDAYDALAADTGAKIVHSCGYDSIPSDLQVWLLAQHAGEPLDTVYATAYLKGGFSGGTLDSLRTMVEQTAADHDKRRLARDPYALSPGRAAESAVRQPSDSPRPAKGDHGGWTGPFVMASYNTRVVRRSNALLDWEYGKELRYGEVMGFGAGRLAPVLATGVTLGLGALVGAFAAKPLRPLVDRLLPKPGEGPSEQARERGWFRNDVTATTVSGRQLQATVAGPGDPGYKATAVMLAQAAMSLAFDDLPPRAGSLTPAVALGEQLVARLRGAGHTYEVSG